MPEAEKPAQTPPQTVPEQEPITFAEFLESVPPSRTVITTNLWDKQIGEEPKLEIPDLQLHCTTDTCNGLRFFRYRSGDREFYNNARIKYTFLIYVCSNCQRDMKRFSLFIVREDSGSGESYKFGEHPPYGPPTPARLIRLFGKDRETFLKGRRCEMQGLGIGAFVYYRRVVENQKNQILSEIIRVSKKLKAPAEMIETLEQAKTEVQFAKALSSVKDAIPQALFINGHNPLSLLHSALSGGLHEKTDERCLELAHDVRVVLIELAERLGQALKDEAELNTAVKRLLNAGQVDVSSDDTPQSAEPPPISE
jgi:hypothetical protein